MRLLHLADVPVTARDHVFFHSRTRALVLAAAVETARKTCGFDLTEANQFVDGLRGQRNA